MLDESLPKCWWGCDIIYCTMSRNRGTKYTFQNMDTPFQRFFNREADLKIFNPFGCTALIYIYRYQEGKGWMLTRKVEYWYV